MPFQSASAKLLKKADRISACGRDAAFVDIVNEYIFGQGQSRVKLLPVPYKKYNEEDVAERYISDQTLKGSDRYTTEPSLLIDHREHLRKEASSSSSTYVNHDKGPGSLCDLSLTANDSHLYADVDSFQYCMHFHNMYTTNQNKDGSSQTLCQSDSLADESRACTDISPYENVQTTHTHHKKPVEQTIQNQNMPVVPENVYENFDYHHLRKTPFTEQNHVALNTEYKLAEIDNTKSRLQKSNSFKSMGPIAGRASIATPRFHSGGLYSLSQPNKTFGLSSTAQIAYGIARDTAERVKIKSASQDCDMDVSNPTWCAGLSSDTESSSITDIDSSPLYQTYDHGGFKDGKPNASYFKPVRTFSMTDGYEDLMNIKDEVHHIINRLKQRFVSFGHNCSKGCTEDHSPQKHLPACAGKSNLPNGQITNTAVEGSTKAGKLSHSKNLHTFEVLQPCTSSPLESSLCTWDRYKPSSKIQFSDSRNSKNEVRDQRHGLQYRTFQFEVEKVWSNGQIGTSDTPSRSTSSEMESTYTLIEALKDKYTKEDLDQSDVNVSNVDGISRSKEGCSLHALTAEDNECGNIAGVVCTYGDSRKSKIHRNSESTQEINDKGRHKGERIRTSTESGKGKVTKVVNLVKQIKGQHLWKMGGRPQMASTPKTQVGIMRSKKSTKLSAETQSTPHKVHFRDDS